MIDHIVAIDKLSGFETAGEIADFLGSQGVQGCVGMADRCAISVWMQEVTGDRLINTSNMAIWTLAGGDPGRTLAQPPAPVVQQFITNFDAGMYPRLVNDWTFFRASDDEYAYEADDDLYRCEDEGLT